MPYLSAIVIAYKVERYLRQCIESVINQTYLDFECVIVDDGSPDSCPQICDEYARKDHRITVIHQENQGSVMARWNGIKAASGEYIIVIDGDDWIEPDMFEKMVSLSDNKEKDMVVVGYKVDSSNGSTNRRNEIKSGNYSGDQMHSIYERALYTGKFYKTGLIPSFWEKMIRRKLFFDDFVPADSIIKMGDDAACTYPMIARSKSIVVNNEFCPYHYRMVDGSQSKAFDERYFERAEALMSGLSKNLKLNPEMAEDLPYYALFILGVGIYRLLEKSISIPIMTKIRMIKNGCKRVTRQIDLRNVDWSGFSAEERKQYKRLSKNRVNGFILSHYANRCREKLKEII